MHAQKKTYLYGNKKRIHIFFYILYRFRVFAIVVFSECGKKVSVMVDALPPSSCGDVCISGDIHESGEGAIGMSLRLNEEKADASRERERVNAYVEEREGEGEGEEEGES